MGELLISKEIDTNGDTWLGKVWSENVDWKVEDVRNGDESWIEKDIQAS